MAESKSRLLYILKYLWQNTDAEHYATTADILAFLKGNGISCDRKTILGDIAKLCDIGIDIEEERSRENRYSLSSHLFTLPELKLLIDAVESSKFITVPGSGCRSFVKTVSARQQQAGQAFSPVRCSAPTAVQSSTSAPPRALTPIRSITAAPTTKAAEETVRYTISAM